MSKIFDKKAKYLLIFLLIVIIIFTPLKIFVIYKISKDYDNKILSQNINEIQLNSGPREIKIDSRKVHPEIIKKIKEKPQTKVSVVILTEDNYEQRNYANKKRSKNKRIVSSSIDANQLQELADDDSTVGIYPDRKYYLLSQDNATQGIVSFFNSGIKGENIKVAILDTGINPGSFNIIEEAVFTNETHTSDFLNHGTQIARIISEIAPEVSILNAKVINDEGEGFTSWIIESIMWSMDNNADVIIMSFGNPSSEIDVPLDDRIKEAIDNGVVVVVAAGNCGEGCPDQKCNGYIGVTSPGNSAYAITVGAVNQNNEIACFSSYGEVNGINKPDLVAPLTEGYSGTSMSTAYAAGIIVLLVESYPDNTPKQIKDLLTATATDLGDEGRDHIYGAGLINVENLLIEEQEEDNTNETIEEIYEDIQDDLEEIEDSEKYDETIEENNEEDTPILDVYTPLTFEDYKIYDLDYDENGNLLQGLNSYYEYNSLNQLIRVREDDSNGRVIEEYFYDETGQRIKKITYDSDGNSKTTYYPDSNFVREVDDSGIKDIIYYYDEDSLVGRKDPDGKLYFYHPNHLGSTDIVTDENGNIVEETKYLPFGEVIEGGDSRYLFTGQEKDKETGLMYYNSRYYNSFLRHFTQPDTILPDIYDPQQLNRYSYARNNPIKYVDETGHVIDIIADIGFIIWDIVDIVKNPFDKLNWVALGADVGCAFVPIATGAGRVIKIGSKVKKSLRIGKAVDKVNDAVKAFDRGDDAKDIVNALKKVERKPRPKSVYDEMYKDLPVEKLNIDELQKTHDNTHVRDILSKADHQDPIDIFMVGDKPYIIDGIGRTTREVWKGKTTIQGRVLYQIDDINKIPQKTQDIFNLNKAEPFDIKKTKELLEKSIK